jgi:hypothetical protein
VARFLIDFTGLAAGALPVGMFEEIWSQYPQYRWSLEANADNPSGIVLKHLDPEGSDNWCLAWKDVPQSSDAKIAALLSATSTYSSVYKSGVVVRASAGDTGYRLSFFGQGVIRLNRLPDGTSLANLSYPWTVNTKHWLELDIAGTSLDVYAWPFGSAKPETPLASVVDSAIPGPGDVGLANWRMGNTARFYFIGIGTNGDPAPTEPVNIAVPRRKWRNAPFGFIG